MRLVPVLICIQLVIAPCAHGAPVPGTAAPEDGSGAGTGTQLIIAGAAVGLIGVLHKFGEAEGRFDEDNNVVLEEKGYDAVNAVLMAVGGGLIVGGLIMTSRDDPAAETVALAPTPPRLALGVRVTF